MSLIMKGHLCENPSEQMADDETESDGEDDFVDWQTSVAKRARAVGVCRLVCWSIAAS